MHIISNYEPLVLLQPASMSQKYRITIMREIISNSVFWRKQALIGFGTNKTAETT